MLSLHKGLDAAAERHRVTVHNAANVNTPNFKRKEVSFEEDLRTALQKTGKLPLATTRPGHMGGRTGFHEVRHTVNTDNRTSMRTDGNNVDIDREMAVMAANQLNYNALTQVMNERYSLMRYVIHEGKR
ncbi:MAG: flagellar basal body rod protein FlgB [Clostridiales bacterium]|jgi:flagellar basal-body rod protein FlgB|nr:flagellar basal body rod protein FlgB [Clostridiales bacterium]